MKQFKIYHAPLMAFFSAAFYRDVAREWRGTGFGYLFLLVTLLCLLMCARLHVVLQKAPGQAGPFLEKFPEELTIHKGIISTKEARRYSLDDPDTGKPLAIIDTSLEVPPANLGGARLFVARTKIAMAKNKYETRFFDLSAIDDLVVTPEKLKHWMEVLFAWLAAVLFPFALAWLYLYRIVQALIFSVAAVILLSAFKTGLGYKAALRLTVMAMSAPLLVFELADICGRKIPFAGMLYFFAVLAFVFFAAYSQKQKAAESPNVPPPAG